MSARGQGRRDALSGEKILAVGLRPQPLADLYHSLLTARWWQFLLIVVVAYVSVNALFALVYLALGDAIEHARPGSFADAFFFSVQTMATVGYGNFWPRTTVAMVWTLNKKASAKLPGRACSMASPSAR